MNTCSLSKHFGDILIEKKKKTKKDPKNLEHSNLLHTFALPNGKETFLEGEDSLAQQAEHNTFNVGVLGSNPRRITIIKANLLIISS